MTYNFYFLRILQIRIYDCENTFIYEFLRIYEILYYLQIFTFTIFTD